MGPQHVIFSFPYFKNDIPQKDVNVNAKEKRKESRDKLKSHS
jgi:hypothetical protein